MTIVRQGISFLIVGCALIVLDWMVFVLMSWMGMPTAWANIIGRVVGAVAGFAANGGITFRRGDASRYGFRRFGRFAVLWLALTLLSTVLVTVMADQLSLRVAWLAKPVVEGVLAVVSFFVSRNWVYV